MSTNPAHTQVTVNFLVELDKLIQLLESPIFTQLRLQLLEPQRHAHLIKALYGLLMLLPQTTAYHTLKERLSCVPTIFHSLQKLEKYVWSFFSITSRATDWPCWNSEVPIEDRDKQKGNVRADIDFAVGAAQSSNLQCRLIIVRRTC